MTINNIDELKNFVFIGIISADNDEFGLTEDQKQEIISRHNESTNWSYILECMPEQYKSTLIRFFEKTDEQ